MHEIGFDDTAFARCDARMAEIGEQLLALRRYVRREVCGRTGFTGLLAPLGDVLDQIADAVDDAADDWVRRWDDVRDEVLSTGRRLVAADDVAAATFRTIGGRL